eukprot:1752871-Rhodomonas_salina.1
MWNSYRLAGDRVKISLRLRLPDSELRLTRPGHRPSHGVEQPASERTWSAAAAAGETSPRLVLLVLCSARLLLATVVVLSCPASH